MPISSRVCAAACARSGIATRELPEGVRCRETATERFWFNHRAEPVTFEGRDLPAAGVLRDVL